MIALNRRGVTRTVILTKRYAIKVPSGRGLSLHNPGYRFAGLARGILANQSEYEWSQVTGVNPVLWSLFFLVNVYRRAEVPTSLPEDFDYDALVPDYVLNADRKPDNIGWLDGRYVWVDYDQSWNGPGPRYELR